MAEELTAGLEGLVRWRHRQVDDDPIGGESQ
jgi:hypothetical protein